MDFKTYNPIIWILAVLFNSNYDLNFPHLPCWLGLWQCWRAMVIASFIPHLREKLSLFQHFMIFLYMCVYIYGCSSLFADSVFLNLLKHWNLFVTPKSILAALWQSLLEMCIWKTCHPACTFPAEAEQGDFDLFSSPIVNSVLFTVNLVSCF